MFIHPGDTILFQGDSITDTDRDRSISDANMRKALGSGYAGLAAAALLGDFATQDEADRLRVFNRGIGGNKVTDLATRWKDDCLAIVPNVLSILIGVNDTWHGIGKGDASKGVPVAEYERVYHDLLEQARATNADLRLILCEPFVLRCGAVSDAWLPEMDARREVTRRLAGEFDAVLVPFQNVFDDALDRAPAKYWAPDGVHPSPAGHMLMARAWLAATENRPQMHTDKI